jgi:hypothetical protein
LVDRDARERGSTGTSEQQPGHSDDPPGRLGSGDVDSSLHGGPLLVVDLEVVHAQALHLELLGLQPPDDRTPDRQAPDRQGADGASPDRRRPDRQRANANRAELLHTTAASVRGNEGKSEPVHGRSSFG